jgi:hypothetical protein
MRVMPSDLAPPGYGLVLGPGAYVWDYAAVQCLGSIRQNIRTVVFLGHIVEQADGAKLDSISFRASVHDVKDTHARL